MAFLTQGKFHTEYFVIMRHGPILTILILEGMSDREAFP